MNKFENELKLLFGDYNDLRDKLFCDKMMIGVLNDAVNVKITFSTKIEAKRYYGMLVEIINKKTGLIDKHFFEFSNIIGKSKTVSGDVISFYLWDCDGRVDWYGPAPTPTQRKKIADTIIKYIELYK